MINFERISWQQLLTLCKVIHLSSSLNLKTVTRWYNSESTNFDDTLEFLENLEVVKIKDNKIEPNKILKQVIGSNGKSIEQFFVDILFHKENNLIKYFADFFGNFEVDKDSYRFTPTTQERLKYSGIRNFLISLGVLRFEAQSNSYSIRKELVTHLFDKNKVLTYHQFEKRIKSEKEIGFAAERRVYIFEKSKFKNNPEIQRRVRHVSLENVMAGYDINSFEIHNNKKLISKYVEVKAVSEDDWKFYWSRNEVDKARQLGKNYYLYLIPVKKGKIVNTSAWRQIKDPYWEVFLDKRTWKQEIEVISFITKT